MPRSRRRVQSERTPPSASYQDTPEPLRQNVPTALITVHYNQKVKRALNLRMNTENIPIPRS